MRIPARKSCKDLDTGAATHDQAPEEKPASDTELERVQITDRRDASKSGTAPQMWRASSRPQSVLIYLTLCAGLASAVYTRLAVARAIEKTAASHNSAAAAKASSSVETNRASCFASSAGR